MSPGHIERVGSDSGGEGCSIFYLEVTGQAVFNKKNRGIRNAISIYTPIANSFTPERACSVTKFHFGDAKFLTNRERIPS